MNYIMKKLSSKPIVKSRVVSSEQKNRQISQI